MLHRREHDLVAQRSVRVGIIAGVVVGGVLTAVLATNGTGAKNGTQDLDVARAARNMLTVAECQKNGWRVIPLTKIMALHRDGTQGPAKANDNEGRAYYFGGMGYEPVPPPGFKPLDATDKELKAYGFEPRPADPALMAHWRSLYANYQAPRRREPPPVECQTNIGS
ncbi:MAG: hypothetical protein QOE84_1980 [Actinomycetota bacterium]|nr:hypothetical protein [Actinomycetota bacterium]